MPMVRLGGGRARFVRGSTTVPASKRRRGRALRTRNLFKGKSWLAKAITKIVKRNEETKYVAFQVNDNQIYGNLDPNATAADFGGDIPEKRLFLAVPPVGQGTGPNNRIGNSINPIKCQVTCQYFFVAAPLPGGQDTNGVENSDLIEVRQIALKPKTIRRWRDYAATAAPLDTGYRHILPRLLERGDGTYSPANGNDPLNHTYPLNNECVTRIAGNKKFLMGKNTGVLSQATSPLTTIRAQNTVRFNVKLPKTLKYDETTGNLPENCCPLFGAYAALIHNVSALNYDSLQKPYFPLTIGPTHPILQMSYRVEMWYKDA